jgi:transcriptional regulator with XRE-family HTH domain
MQKQNLYNWEGGLGDNMGNPNMFAGEMIKQPFFDWIIQERDKRQWNDAELSVKAGISHSSLSMIMSGQRNVTDNFCRAIARAFKIRPEMALARAGLLPADTMRIDQLVEWEADLIIKLRQLPEAYQIAIQESVNGLYDRFGQKDSER